MVINVSTDRVEWKTIDRLVDWQEALGLCIAYNFFNSCVGSLTATTYYLALTSVIITVESNRGCIVWDRVFGVATVSVLFSSTLDIWIDDWEVGAGEDCNISKFLRKWVASHGRNVGSRQWCIIADNCAIISDTIERNASRIGDYEVVLWTTTYSGLICTDELFGVSRIDVVLAIFTNNLVFGNNSITDIGHSRITHKWAWDGSILSNRVELVTLNKDGVFEIKRIEKIATWSVLSGNTLDSGRSIETVGELELSSNTSNIPYRRNFVGIWAT